MWAVLFVIASTSIMVQFYASWQMYSYSSTEIIVDDPRYSLNKIDFPAITVCSVNKILYSKAKQFILKYDMNNFKIFYDHYSSTDLYFNGDI